MISIRLADKPVSGIVRICCSKFSYPAQGDDLDKRLLTEVEIY